MLRQLSVSLLVLLYCVVSFAAQSGLPSRKSDDLYLRAFAAFLEKRNFMYEGNDFLRKQNYLNVLVEKDLQLTEGLPTTIGKNSVEYLDYAGRVDRYKRLRSELRIIVLRPAKNAGNTLIFSFSEYLWSIKGNKTYYALSDGARVSMKFDCIKQEFVVDSVELWGV